MSAPRDYAAFAKTPVTHPQIADGKEILYVTGPQLPLAGAPQPQSASQPGPQRTVSYYRPTPVDQSNPSGNFGEVKFSEDSCIVVSNPRAYLEALAYVPWGCSRDVVAQHLPTAAQFLRPDELELFWQGQLIKDSTVPAVLKPYTTENFSSQPNSNLMLVHPPPEVIKARRSHQLTISSMVTKVYKTDNPIFSDLMLLSEVESQSPFVHPIPWSDTNTKFDPTDLQNHRVMLPYRKRMLEDLFGIRIHVQSTNEGATASISMRKFEKWDNKGAQSTADLKTLLDIFAHFGLTHSDVKPDNIMSDLFQRSWLVDLDNLIQQTQSGGFSCDSRFYRFRNTPTFEERVSHDKALVASIIATNGGVTSGSGPSSQAAINGFQEQKSVIEQLPQLYVYPRPPFPASVTRFTVAWTGLKQAQGTIEFHGHTSGSGGAKSAVLSPPVMKKISETPVTDSEGSVHISKAGCGGHCELRLISGDQKVAEFKFHT